MEAGEFLAALRRHTAFASAEDALRASRATLMTLGERLQGDEPRHLAAHLPPEIAQYLYGEGMGRGERLSAPDFLRRISEREGVDVETARIHARAVVEVLYQALSEAEVLDPIAAHFRGLFDGPAHR